MKKIITLVFTVVMLLAVTAVFASAENIVAYPVEGGNIYFDKDSGTVYSADETVTNVTIPNYIDGVQVTGVFWNAFNECSNITSITVPAGVSDIAFVMSWHQHLEDIHVDKENPKYASIDGVVFDKNIKNIVFIPAGKTGSYVIPDGVKGYINEYPIDTYITDITIPNSFETLGLTQISAIGRLKSINIYSDNPNFSSIDGVLYSKDGKTLIAFPSGKCEEFTIPEGVTSIGSYAFNDRGIGIIKKVNIPASVKNINHDAFTSSLRIEEINVDSNNTVYSSLDGVLYNKDRTYLYRYPSSKKDSVFYVPTTVEDMYIFALSLAQFQEIVLPATFRDDHFSSISFSECLDLERIIVNENNNDFMSIDGVLYSKDGKILLKYPSKKEGKEFIVPSFVESIASDAFTNVFNCQCQRIVLHDNVKELAYYISGGFSGSNEYISWTTIYICYTGTESEWNELSSNHIFTIPNIVIFNYRCHIEGHDWGKWYPEIDNLGWNTPYRICPKCTVIEYGETVPANPFSDVKSGQWYTDGIIWCYQYGYMAGVSETEFGRKTNLNRAMFATILAKIDGGDLSEYEGKTSFSDVKTGQWYSCAIEWAYQNGYAAGLGEGVFGRKADISREQIALFFYTYSRLNGADVSDRADLSQYTDLGRVHSWALDAVQWAVAKGLISGTSETTLSPRDSATRAEIALIVKNYVETVKE